MLIVLILIFFLIFYFLFSLSVGERFVEPEFGGQGGGAKEDRYA
jgi:hypothetical protein